MRKFYFECSSGVAGDMLLAAFISLGIAPNELNNIITRLNLDDVNLIATKDKRNGIAGELVTINYPTQKSHRHLPDIYQIIDNSHLSNSVKTHAKNIFKNIAKAEAKVHGTSIDHVHFHEVGAIDSIVDVILNCWCFDYLSQKHKEVIFLAGPINVGGGTVWTEHGQLPVPAPAVSLLSANLTIYGQNNIGELATPTGVALLEYFCETALELPRARISNTGIGLGHKQLPHANIIRVFELEEPHINISPSPASKRQEHVLELETNIDDCPSEILAYTAERLLEAGALDISFTPIFMKKGRPAYKLAALSLPADKEKISKIILKETTAFGLRYCVKKRDILDREFKTIQFQDHSIRIKIGSINGEIISSAPEYSDCANAARHLGIPIKSVFEACKKPELLLKGGSHEAQ